jgi:hypothetical protein
VNEELRETLERCGYRALRELPTGEIAGVMSMLYTTGLFLGLTSDSWRTRYCYESPAAAKAALLLWDGRGDPPGPWIKEKPSDRIGPGASE